MRPQSINKGQKNFKLASVGSDENDMIDLFELPNFEADEEVRCSRTVGRIQEEQAECIEKNPKMSLAMVLD